MVFPNLLLFIDNHNHSYVHAKNRAGPILAWVILAQNSSLGCFKAQFIQRVKHLWSSESRCAIIFLKHVIVLAIMICKLCRAFHNELPALRTK